MKKRLINNGKFLKENQFYLKERNDLKTWTLDEEKVRIMGKRKIILNIFRIKKNQYYRFWGIKYDVFRVGSF